MPGGTALERPWISVRFRLPAIVLFTAVLGAAVFGLRGIGVDNSIDVFLVEGDRKYEDFQFFRRHFGSGEVIVAAVKGKDLLTPAGFPRLREAATGLAAIDGVVSVRSAADFPFTEGFVAAGRGDQLLEVPYLREGFLKRAPSGEITAGVFALLRGGLTTADRKVIVEAMEARFAALREAGLVLHAAGSPVLNVALDRASRSQSRKLFPILAVVALAVLAALTRSLRATLLIAVNLLVTLPVALAAVNQSGVRLNMITTALPAILLVVCNAGAIHLYRAFAGCDPASTSNREAATHAAREVFGPCLAAAVTNACGFLALSLSDLRPIRHMGIFAAVGIVFSFLATVTFLPALLATGFVPRRAPRATVRHRMPIPIPPPTLVVALGAVLVAGAVIGLLRIRVESATLRFLPEDHETVKDYAAVQEDLTGLGTVELLLESDRPGTFATPNGLAMLRAFSEQLRRVPGVVDVTALPDVMDLALFAARTAGAAAPPPDQLAALAANPALLIEKVIRPTGLAALLGSHLVAVEGGPEITRVRVASRALEVGAFRTLVEGIERATGDTIADSTRSRITGLAPMMIQMQQYLTEGQVKSLAGAILVTALVLIGTLRSLRLSIIGAIPNLFPILVIYGAMGLMGLPLNVATVMVGAIAMGIAVDDTVHILAIYDRRKRPDKAVAAALGTVWWPVVATSVVNTLGFSVLAVSSFVPLKLFGLVTAATMIIASAADLFLLIALLRLFGPRAERDVDALRGAATVLDRIGGRPARSGRLHLDLGITAYRQAERLYRSEPEKARKLYSEALDSFREYLATPAPDRSDAAHDARRVRARAASTYYAALCLTGLARLEPDAVRTRVLWDETLSALADFDSSFPLEESLGIAAGYARLRALGNLGRASDARLVYSTMESLDPEHPYTLRAAAKLARILIDDAKTIPDPRARDDALYEAYSHYRTWLFRSLPDDLDSWTRVGRYFMSIGKHRDALPILEQAHARFRHAQGLPKEKTFENLRHLARACLETGDRAKAAPLYTELLSAASPWRSDPDVRAEARRAGAV